MSLTAEQVEARKRGVGCSELLAALGKDPRCSRLELYKRKVGELPELDLSDEERIIVGDVLEPGLRELFSRKLGFPIVKPDETVFHPELPLVGHPDGIVLSDDQPGIEFKNRDKYIFSEEYGEDWTDQVPIRDLVQCTGYMILTRKQRWLMGVLAGGNERHVFDIRYDEQLVAAIKVGVRDFWTHVEQRRPPNPETPEEVKLRWPKDLGTTVVATREISDLCVELAGAKSDLKEAETQKEAIEAKVKMFMEENAQLVDSDGTLLATWKTAKDSLRFDEALFAKENPDLYAQYQRRTPGSRRFLLKVK